ncbi:zinc-dependent peptidase [Thiomicrorhabdus cannonii]|uniref:M90 family metallopeptidase n=1 Tax=Thiomicrorhabdus cannonii TaxID=2748011 RepID=UPI0015B9AC37|nr:M90 family metallopeptidase [Thiomicrorhabdus cannonii]
MKWLKNLLTRYALKHHPLNHTQWQRLMTGSPLFSDLSAVEKAHLRELTILFLERKHFSGALGLPIDDTIRTTIAAQACLLLINLNFDYFDDWSDVVVYPSTFKVKRHHADKLGIVSAEEQTLGGEAWLKGPVIIAWDSAVADMQTPRFGHNVVIHEFAHKLDMLNGKANGMPPLHADMPRQEWTQALSNAFETLQRQVSRGHRTAIDAYAATSPAEFFAVCSELFFSAPQTLHRAFPEVYAQLALFYRQDTLKRHPSIRRPDNPSE